MILAAKQVHKTQFEQSPLAPEAPGAVRAPVPGGTEVSAGRREA